MHLTLPSVATNRAMRDHGTTRPALALLAMSMALAIGLGGSARPCQAVTSERNGSILVFPGIVVSSERDTRLQLSNFSNSLRFARCSYIEERRFPGQSPRQQLYFQVRLERQSTWQWVVSAGLQQVPPPCGLGSTCFVSPDIIGPPNVLIPPLDAGFSGALLCVETDPSDFPLPGNALLGVVSTYDLQSGEISQNNAIGVAGFDTNNMDETLCLGGDVTEACASGAEYEGCPTTWYLHAITAGSGTLWSSDDSGGELLVVACSQDFLHDTPGNAILHIRVTNEFGNLLSTTASVVGYTALSLQTIHASASTIGSESASISIVASGGILVAGSEHLQFPSTISTTAVQASNAADTPEADMIVLPPR